MPQSRAEMHQLRQDLQATRALLERPASATIAATETAAANAPQNGSVVASTRGAPASSTSQCPTPLEERVQKLEDSTSLIGSKIDEQYQTKVETASKYRARLHGIVLMNAFRNVGGSDNLDFPSYSEPVPAGWSSAQLSAPHCASRKSDSKSLARASPGPGHRPMCNSISPEDFPPPATA